MFGKIFEMLIGPILDRTLSPITDLVKQHMLGKITEAELKAKTKEVLISNMAVVEKAHADSITSTYNTFIKTAAKTPGMMRVWMAVAISQLAVLLWHQFGISALCFFMGDNKCWPSSGTTVDWSYALLALCLGGGAVMFRTGPAKVDWKDLIK